MARKARKEAKKHTVLLDKERDLTLDMAAIADIHEHAGVNLLKGDGIAEKLTEPKALSVVVWALIGGEDSDLTIREVQRLMALDKLPDITDAVVSAVLDTKGESDEGKASPAEGAASEE